MGLMRGRLVLAVTAFALAGTAFGHGAARGLHLHLDPEPAAPGTEVQVSFSAEAPIAGLTVGFAGEQPLVRALDPPRRHTTVTLAVPEDAGEERPASRSVQAEVTTEDGRTLRASALLALERTGSAGGVVRLVADGRPGFELLGVDDLRSFVGLLHR